MGQTRKKKVGPERELGVGRERVERAWFGMCEWSEGRETVQDEPRWGKTVSLRGEVRSGDQPSSAILIPLGHSRGAKRIRRSDLQAYHCRSKLLCQRKVVI